MEDRLYEEGRFKSVFRTNTFSPLIKNDKFKFYFIPLSVFPHYVCAYTTKNVTTD